MAGGEFGVADAEGTVGSVSGGGGGRVADGAGVGDGGMVGGRVAVTRTSICACSSTVGVGPAVSGSL